jgi:uncharacterized protein (TIGR02246 family)
MSNARKRDAPPTAESPAVQALTRFYEAEARYSASGSRADREALLSTLHRDIVLYQPQSLPYGGEWHGREGFGQWLDAFTRTWADVTPTDPVLYACKDDVLISTVTMRARAFATGVEIAIPICQVIRFADGLPIEWRNFAWDTAAMLDALGSRPATARHANDEADIRRRIDELVHAIRAMDLDGVKSIYAPDIVSFDIVPPLQHLGAEAQWSNWEDVFTAYRPPLDYEVRDLTITLGDDVAFGHSLNRFSGTLKSGKKSELWLRWTTCFRKIDGNWRIAHHQASVPMDPQSGRALLDLEP